MTRKSSAVVLVAMLAMTRVAIAQLGSPTCLAAQHAVTEQQAKISAFQLTRNSPQYAGPAITVYQSNLKALQAQLAALQAGAELACSATGTAALNGDIRPKYMLLTVIYAPPGTAGGKTSSFVDYSTGSTLGSTVDVSHAFKSDYSVSAGLSVNGGVASANVTLSDEWTAQQTTTDEYKVDSTAKMDKKVPGPSVDGIDHGYDEFVLWLNPILHVTVQGKKLTYTPGVDGSALQSIYVYASELKNPTTMRADVAAALNARGLTVTDYNNILSADPFANGSASINDSRFVQLSTTFPYEPPLTATDLQNVTTYTITNDATSTVTKQTIGTNTFSITASATVSGGIVSATVSTKDSWTWTQTNSEANSSGSTSSATVAIGDPSYGYSGNISQIAVYWDTIFNAFMFAPVPLTTQSFFTGTLSDLNQKPLQGQKVVLVADGRVFQTYTDRNGVYKFYGLTPITKLTGSLNIGTTKRNVTINPAPVKLDVTLRH